ncbi:response regulator [Cohnella sp. GCM10027633]|uniref:response regulator n=1 Tax=unclassified Cohnella TaxID=2636738 RepID=UPI00362ABCF5
MLKELILNFVIMSVYLFIVSPLFIREGPLSRNKLVYRLAAGGVFGALGTILLFFSINVGDHTPLNMRGVALMLAAYFGGPAGALSELFVVYVARFLKEGSLDPVQCAIGVSAALGTGILFAWMRSYAAKWVVGTAFLLNYYYFGLWLAGQISIATVWDYILYQAAYSALIAALLFYLIRNEQDRRMRLHAERETSFILRMQPGFTFRFKRRNGSYYYTLIEGQLLPRIGAEPSDFIGKQLEEVRLFPAEYASFLKGQYDRAWEGEQVSHEKQFSEVMILVTLHPVEQDGVVSDVVGTAIDITDLKKRQEADESNRAKSRFLAQMSHEIRTPINAIIGLNYILQQTDLDARQQDYIAKSITAAKSLLSIVNDVLDFSKIEANKVVLEHIEFDLYEVLHNLSNLVSFKAHEKGLKFRFSIHRDVPQMLVGDPFRLQQILLNVTNNAVKFTSRGELEISVNMGEGEAGGARVVFSIRDTGIGMTEPQMEGLFREFTQADMTTTRTYGGTGLGLVISKKFAELMGGGITVRSRIGEGSTFTIELPFLSADSAEPDAGNDRESHVVRVLLVCADLEMQWVLRRQLGQFKLVVHVAASAAEARDKLNNGGTYALVLLDWKLQGDDPERFAEEIRSRKSAGSPAIAIISAYHETELQALAPAAHIDKALLYPISQSQLYNEIIELVALQSIFKPPATAGPEGARPYAALKGAVVLLVEDNEINQIVAKELLRDFVARVDVAGNGIDAVALANSIRYDAILMDLQMPEMDGYEATREILRLDTGRDVPIIAMTADAMKGVEEQVLAIGMVAYLTKPFDPIELYNALQRFVRPAPKAEVAEAAIGDTLDREAALRRLGGNAELYGRILALFVSEHANGVALVREALAAGDAAEAANHAHSLKGVAANIGAVRLAEAMARLQSAADGGGDASDVERLLRLAETELRAVLRDIAAV